MRAAEAKASLLEAERVVAAARAEAEAEREARLSAERRLDTARAEREEEAAELRRATAAGGALQGRLEAAQAECAKLQAKLTELEAQKGGGGGLGGLNLAEMEMGALRGELEGWRLVALDAQERQQRLEVDLKASQIEIKASCAPTPRLAPQPPPPFSPPCTPLPPPCPRPPPYIPPSPATAITIPSPCATSTTLPISPLLLAGPPSHACRRSLAPNLKRGHWRSCLRVAVRPLTHRMLAKPRNLRNPRGGSAQH